MTARSAETIRRDPPGYTIVELSIVLAIVGVLAAVGGGQYMSYLDRARTARAVAELQAIAKQFEPLPDEDRTYPASLADAGITMLDPWGNPYRYLLISGNLPRGLTGTLDSLPHVAAPGGGSAAGAVSVAPSGGGAPTATSGDPTSGSASAANDPASGAAAVVGDAASGAGGAGGAGNPGGAGAGGGAAGAAGGGSIMGEVRKDRFQVPINSDFDLYSTGPDGETRAPLSAPMSRDDIIRANDGSYYGVAEDF